MLMRDASPKQRIPCIIRISIFGAFSAGKKCPLYKGKYGKVAELIPALKKHNADHERFSNFRPIRFVLLLLLDLSTVDTVDHSTLLLHLRIWFGVKGSALAWFESYLASCKYYIQLEGYKSSLRSLDFGVPQGSVLGPLLYVLYTSPEADIRSLMICSTTSMLMILSSTSPLKLTPLMMPAWLTQE